MLQPPKKPILPDNYKYLSKSIHIDFNQSKYASIKWTELLKAKNIMNVPDDEVTLEISVHDNEIDELYLYYHKVIQDHNYKKRMQKYNKDLIKYENDFKKIKLQELLLQKESLEKQIHELKNEKL
jgi:hypothetical protein